MNLMAHFNYRLAIAERKGYAREVSFNIDPLAGVPLPSLVASSPATGGKETGRSPLTGKSADVRASRMQLHRSNRNPRYFTAEARRLKQESNERYRIRRKELRMAKARLVQQAFALEGES